MNNFNFRVSVLTASIFEVLHKVASGEDITTPFVEYPEPTEDE